MNISYETNFCMAHVIEGHPKCGVIHGHNYRVIVSISVKDDEFYDFADLKNLVEGILDANFDHSFSGFKFTPDEFKKSDIDIKRLSMSAENIAERIEFMIRGHTKYPDFEFRDVHVQLWETPKFSVSI